MAFLGYLLQYMLKINLGIAIVCMVNGTAINSHKSEDKYNETNFEFNNTNSSTITNMFSKTSDSSSCAVMTKHSSHLDGPYLWSKSIQGLTLSSYFYGYLITQVEI